MIQDCSLIQTAVATYDVYLPDDLFDCLQVLVISQRDTHPPPLSIKTPPLIEKCFVLLPLRLEWKLTDATPRLILLGSGFMQGLRQVLAWDVHGRDPSF